MPSTVHDDELLRYADRLKGQTVVITGGAKGIGKSAVLEMARRGANIVIGDIDAASAEETVSEVRSLGCKAEAKKCNVLEYDDLVSLFEFAITAFGQVDVVVPCAGVSEIGGFTEVRMDEEGRPKQPQLKTVQINLISVIHTTQLAYFYMNKNTYKNSLKTLVLVASMGAFSGIPGAPMYAASKHGLIGMMRSLRPEFALSGLRIVAMCPWFVDTQMLSPAFKAVMTGIPMAPLDRVVGALILAATDTDPESSGSAYTVPDDREVYKVEHMSFDVGVYKQLTDRIERLQSFVHNMKTFIAFTKLFLGSALGKLLFGALVGFLAYRIAL